MFSLAMWLLVSFETCQERGCSATTADLRILGFRAWDLGDLVVGFVARLATWRVACTDKFGSMQTRS